MFRCTLKVVVQVTLLTFVIFFLRSKRQSMGYGSTWLERELSSLHHLIILLKLLTNWTCFCLQGFLAKRMCKSHSYLVHGAGKVLVQEVQPVLTWSSHVLNLCTVLPNNQPFNNQPIAILRELSVYFMPLFDKCD